MNFLTGGEHLLSGAILVKLYLFRVDFAPPDLPIGFFKGQFQLSKNRIVYPDLATVFYNQLKRPILSGFEEFLKPPDRSFVFLSPFAFAHRTTFALGASMA
jgi:hypothetical protein